VNEKDKTLKLWVRRKRGTKKLVCSGCGRHCGVIHDTTEREVRDLPWSEYRATVVVEIAPGALSGLRAEDRACEAVTEQGTLL
jgi:hypothetical protein